MERTARCCCGDAFLKVSGEPILYGVCHCDNCKQRTGSAFGMSAYFRDDQVVERKGKMSTYAIRDEHQRSFCSNCGTTLFWKSELQPDAIGVAAGCFTEKSLPEPELTVSNEGKYDWITLPSSWSTKI